MEKTTYWSAYHATKRCLSFSLLSFPSLTPVTLFNDLAGKVMPWKKAFLDFPRKQRQIRRSLIRRQQRQLDKSNKLNRDREMQQIEFETETETEIETITDAALLIAPQNEH